MTALSNQETNTEFSIHPATKIGVVALRVSNLENQLLFYQQALGFQLHWREENQAGLGAGGADLLRLIEEPDLKRYGGVTGLYHFAVLFPNRRELARAIARLIALKYANYPTDHIMTKTTYLDDPEGNGMSRLSVLGLWSLALIAAVICPSVLQSACGLAATNFVWKHPKSATVSVPSVLQRTSRSGGRCGAASRGAFRRRLVAGCRGARLR